MAKPARSKYRNKRTNGYASAREAKRAQELKLLQAAGKITDLREQVPYELIPAQYEGGRCVERSCKYVADFVYREPHLQHEVVEDAKGFRAPIFRLKKKLLLWRHGIRIREV